MENLYDHITKVHTRITPTEKGWTVETSFDKKIWITQNYNLSLDEIMKIKDQIVYNNFMNLHSLIVKK
jgi:hypothetical protein